MRATLLTTMLACFVLAAFTAGCGGPYTGAPEKLSMPKKKKPKPKVEGDGGPAEPDTCTVDFKAKQAPIASRANRNQADQLAQAADNAMSGIETADRKKKREMVLDALSKTGDALRYDPYSPAAHFQMAVAYAWLGKKKCALAMLERLKELGNVEAELADQIKYKGKVKKHPAFQPFAADAAGAVEN